MKGRILMVKDPIIDCDHIIDDVMNKYHDEINYCFRSWREDDVDEYEIENELFLKLRNNGINCLVKVTEAFDCTGGTISVLSIAWHDKKYGLHLRTYVLEDM